MHRTHAWLLVATLTVACGGATSEPGTGAAGAGGSVTAGAGGSVTAGAAGSATAGAGGADACFGPGGAIPSVPFKLCQSASDCATLPHTVDCCGSRQQVGVRKDQLAAFAACEQAWTTSLPPCGCPSQPDRAEDGEASAPPAVVAVECVNFTQQGGICKTRVP